MSNKVVIPAKVTNLTSEMDERFARAKYFLTYDLKEKSYQFEDNKLAEAHGVGPRVVQHFVNQGVMTFIVPQLGENATRSIQAAGAVAYQGKGNNLQEILDNFQNGTLEKIA